MDIKLIEKFFRKECTPEEVRQLMEWFGHHKLQQEQEDDIFLLWEQVEGGMDDWVISHDSRALLARIHEQIKGKSNTDKNTRRKKVAWKPDIAYWTKAAAVLFVGGISAWLLVGPIQIKEAEKIPEVIALSAPVGIKLTKVLPDGSKVVLNSNSSIAYTDGFSENKRELTLVGEGFFEVARDPLRPFIVHAGELSTTAIGTSFNIKYNVAESTSEVSLTTGKVKLEVLGKGELEIPRLQPGERAKYQPSNESIQVDRFDLREITAWKDGVLYFKETNLKQVVQRLEDWYGVRITLGGNLAKTKSNDWSYTGRFENESLENVLTGIGFVKDFNFEIIGKDVKLLFN